MPALAPRDPSPDLPAQDKGTLQPALLGAHVLWEFLCHSLSHSVLDLVKQLDWQIPENLCMSHGLRHLWSLG